MYASRRGPHKIPGMYELSARDRNGTLVSRIKNRDSSDNFIGHCTQGEMKQVLRLYKQGLMAFSELTLYVDKRSFLIILCIHREEDIAADNLTK